jgi:hypothetical protein
VIVLRGLNTTERSQTTRLSSFACQISCENVERDNVQPVPGGKILYESWKDNPARSPAYLNDFCGVIREETNRLEKHRGTKKGINSRVDALCRLSAVVGAKGFEPLTP